MKLNYILFVDDVRNPLDYISKEIMDKYPDGILVARNPIIAYLIVLKLGIPSLMYLDHDLGVCNTQSLDIKFFLNSLRNYSDCHVIPKYICISSNPVGRKWIEDFMSDWEKYKIAQQCKDIRTRNCCKNCGCKYGEDNCTVTSGLYEQEYKCQDCD